MPALPKYRLDAKKLAKFNESLMQTAFTHLRFSKEPFELAEVHLHSRRIEQLVRINRRFQDLPSVRPDILEPLAENLDISLIPTAGQHNVPTLLTIDLAFKTIVILTGTTYHLRRNAGLMEKLLSIWPSVWAWTHFMLSHELQGDDECSSGIKARGLSCFGRFMGELCIHSTICRAIVATPAVVTEAAICWADECRTGFVSASDIYRCKNDLFAYGLLFVLENSDCRFADHLPAFLCAANGQTNLARIAVRRLQRAIDEHPSDVNLEHVWFHLGLTFQLLCQREHALLNHELLSSGLMLQVIRCLALFNARTSTDLIPKPEMIDLCFIMLNIGLGGSGDSFRWLIRAMKEGLFAIVLDTAKFDRELSQNGDPNSPAARLRMADGGRTRCERLLEDIISPCLVNLRVVRAAATEIARNVYTTKLECGVQERWITFLELVKRRRENMTHMEESCLFVCYHCERNLFENRKAIKQCSRCRIRRYCSAACQKADWRVHKTRCTDADGSDRDDVETPSYETADMVPFWNKFFIISVATGELEMRVEELNAQMDSKYPSVPPSELVFLVRFTVHPPELHVLEPDRSSKDEQDVAVGRDFTRIFLLIEFCWEGQKSSLRYTPQPPDDLRGAEYMLFWQRFFYGEDAASQDDRSVVENGQGSVGGVS